MYVDIWDIEIITHAAKRERERNRDYNGPGIRATGRCRVGVLACVRTTTVAKAASPLSSSLLALLFLSLSPCLPANRPRHACTRLQIGSA